MDIDTLFSVAIPMIGSPLFIAPILCVGACCVLYSIICVIKELIP